MSALIHQQVRRVFLYGHTLFYEPEFDAERGYKEILDFAVKNNNNLSAEDLAEKSLEIRKEICKYISSDIEINNMIFQRLVFDTLGIEYSLSEEEIEMKFWEKAEPIYPMEHALKMLCYLKKTGIRTGIVSNISLSSRTLLRRIQKQLPECAFEFVITSSEYMFRKPNPYMFKAAINKAGLKAEDIWCCGDGIKLDVESSAKCGMYPVWYESDIKCTYRKADADLRPQCPHLNIHDWLELIEILDKLKNTY